LICGRKLSVRVSGARDELRKEQDVKQNVLCGRDRAARLAEVDQQTDIVKHEKAKSRSAAEASTASRLRLGPGVKELGMTALLHR
jgi:hypothetical protein